MNGFLSLDSAAETLIRCGLLVAFTRVAVKCKKRKLFVYAQQRLKGAVGGAIENLRPLADPINAT